MCVCARACACVCVCVRACACACVYIVIPQGGPREQFVSQGVFLYTGTRAVAGDHTPKFQLTNQTAEPKLTTYPKYPSINPAATSWLMVSMSGWMLYYFGFISLPKPNTKVRFFSQRISKNRHALCQNTVCSKNISWNLKSERMRLSSSNDVSPWHESPKKCVRYSLF